MALTGSLLQLRNYYEPAEASKFSSLFLLLVTNYHVSTITMATTADGMYSKEPLTTRLLLVNIS